jgi:phage baseplate assembly protein W
MDDGKTFGKGISFPPHLGADGRWQWSAGAQNIREGIRIVLLTESQERLMLTEFGGGLRQFLFEPNIVTTHRLIQERISQALARWEPRLKVEAVTVARDPVDERIAIATISYSLVASGARDQLSLAIRLAG